jgi:glycerate dehydrogenase
MNSVVLDGYTLNPGDLSWDALRELGRCENYDRSAWDEIVPRSASAEIVLTNKVKLDDGYMLAVPALKYIGVTATGYNVVDVAAARKRKVIVTNVPTGVVGQRRTECRREYHAQSAFRSAGGSSSQG